MSARWQDIEPKDAVNITLPHEGVHGPTVTDFGFDGVDECPWPWDPQQLKGAPLGQYHCGYCGAMVIAGMEHIDYSESDA